MKKFIHYRRDKKIFVKICVLIALILSIFFANKYIDTDLVIGEVIGAVSNKDKSDFSVHVIDVGNADAIYINCKDHNLLIDAGDIDLDNKVVNYLSAQEVGNLDLVVTTHPHRDHIGGIKSVVNNFNIERMMMPELPDELIPTTATYLNMLNAIKQKGIKVDKPIAGEKFNIGDMKVEILGPISSYKDINDYSIVVKVIYGEHSFLFMGDAEKDSERDLINRGYNLKSTVLKVGHHGSQTSTTNEFLSKVSPKIAVISVGENNYSLPKPNVIKRLINKNIEVYRTDKCGTIIFKSDGEELTISIERENI